MEKQDSFVEGILKERYYVAEENSFEQMCRRVARYVASAGIEYKYSLERISKDEEKFYNVMVQKKFMPNSPTLFNSGRGQDYSLFEGTATLKTYETIYKTRSTCLSACFVLPIEDSMQSIFDTLKNAALVTQAGGGLGIDFSPLRPHGAKVASSNKESSGVVPFMKIFDSAARAIKQGGLRRSAFMGILDYNHPDILEFMSAKEANTGDNVLSFFNLSVDIDHEKFSEAIEKNEFILLEHGGKTFSKVKATELLYLMAEKAWRKGCPGIYMSSKQNKYFACSNTDRITSTNACGEQGLPANGNCTLGHINLLETYISEELVDTCMLFLDNVVTMNVFPNIPGLKQTNDKYRNVGLGVMGVADYLISKDMSYSTSEAVLLITQALAKLCKFSYLASVNLAKERGACPAFKNSRWVTEANFEPIAMEDNPKLKEINQDLHRVFNFVRANSLRNIMVNTIAPTGTTSILADTSSGIEPNFAFVYDRNVTNQFGEIETTSLVSKMLVKYFGKEKANELVEQFDNGKIATIASITKNPVFYCAHEIPAVAHLTMQHYAQSYIDNSISKTINLPTDVTIEEVYEIFLFAIHSNCKGVTIYRDGCYKNQVYKNKKNLYGTVKRYDFDNEQFYLEYIFDDLKMFDIKNITGPKNTKYNAELVSLNALKKSHIAIKKFLEEAAKYSEFYKRLLAVLNEITKIENAVSSYDKPLKQDAHGFNYDDDGTLYCPSCKRANSIIMKEGCVSCKFCDWGACS